MANQTADMENQPGPLFSVALAYQRAMDRFTELLGIVAKYLVLVTIVIMVVNVVLRYLGATLEKQLASNTYIEAQWQAYSLIFLFGFAYILKHQINVRVDFWFANQSPRTKAWIDLVGHLLGLLPFAALGIIISLDAVQFSWQVRENSPNAGGLPFYPIKTMMLVGLVFLLLQGIAEFIRVVARLRGIDAEIVEHDAPLRIE